MRDTAFAWAVDIEEVDCPSATPLPFDLDFLDMLQRRDMVNTFGIEEGIRVVSPSYRCDRHCFCFNGREF